MQRTSVALISLLAATAFLGCARQAKPGTVPIAGSLTQAERAAGWRSLFDGKTLDGWREYRGGAPSGWFARDGELSKSKGTVDLITVEEFGDFELSLEWKIAKGGNAGIFYRGTEEYDRVYWSAPEYQLLDDPNARDGASRLTSAGADYGLYPAPEGHLKPAGEWNSTRIIAKGAHVEHWLNGAKLLEYEFWSPDWEAKVQASKFRAWPNYGRSKRGHIAIQGDHSGELQLRNIRIREIK